MGEEIDMKLKFREHPKHYGDVHGEVEKVIVAASRRLQR